MAKEIYAIMVYVKGLDFKPTDRLVGLYGVCPNKEMAKEIATEKTFKSMNYSYVVKKTRLL